MTSPSSSGALEAVERILNRGGKPDDVLSSVVQTLRERTGVRVGIEPLDAGHDPPEGAQTHEIVWEGHPVALLWAAQEADSTLLARVAVIVAPYCR
jgi:hypothetical protein